MNPFDKAKEEIGGYSKHQLKLAIDMARRSDYTEETEMSVAHKYYIHSDEQIFTAIGSEVSTHKEWTSIEQPPIDNKWYLVSIIRDKNEVVMTGDSCLFIAGEFWVGGRHPIKERVLRYLPLPQLPDVSTLNR